MTVCGCHGCRFEKPALEARVAELELLLAAHRREYRLTYTSPATNADDAAAAEACAAFEREVLVEDGSDDLEQRLCRLSGDA